MKRIVAALLAALWLAPAHAAVIQITQGSGTPFLTFQDGSSNNFSAFGLCGLLCTNEVDVDSSHRLLTLDSQSGTWNITNISGTISLPTGAATSALQTTGNASLSTLATASASQATAANQTSGNASLSTIATNTTGVATAANQTTGNSSLSTIATNTTGASTAANQTAVIGTKAAGTAAASSELIGGVYNSSPPSLTTGQQVAAQVDSSGRIIVNCGSGCGGSGGTSLADEAGFTFGSTSLTPIGGVYNSSITALTSGQAGAVALTNNRSMHVLDDNSAALLAAAQGANPVNVNGSVTAQTGLTPGVAQTGTVVAANEDLTSLGGTALGAATNWGTAPTGLKVLSANVNCLTGCSGSTNPADESTFTYGTTTFGPIGGVYNSSITALTSGQMGAVALTAARSMHTLDDNSAALLSAVQGAIPAGSNIIGKVDIDQTTPGTTNGVVVNSSALPTGASTSANQTTANSSLSTIATNTTGVSTAANQTTANSSLSTIATNTTGASTAANQTSVIGTKAAGTAATNSLLTGGVYNSSPPSLTTGQQVAAQVDASGRLIVNCGTGCSGSTNPTDNTGFTYGTSTYGTIGGVYNSSITALTSGNGGAVALTANRSMHTLDDNSAALLSAVQGSIPAGTALIGKVGIDQTTLGTTNGVTVVSPAGNAVTVKGASSSAVATDTSLVVQINPQQTPPVGLSQVNGSALSVSNAVPVAPSPYPATAVPITASATGTAGATTATLTNVSGHTTYICGFSIRANATAAATGNATVTGVITGTLNFTQWTAPNASGLGVTEQVFSPCIPASAVSTSISVVSAAPGTGGVVSVSAWGYSI